MINRRLDYLTLNVERPLTQNIMLRGKDEDGLETTSTVMTLDALGFEFFQAIGKPFSVGEPFITSPKKYYHTDNRTIFWFPYSQKAEIRFSGKFFLEPDYKQTLKAGVDFLSSRGLVFTDSRVDLNYKFLYDGKFEEDLLFKSEFGKLRVRPELLEGNWGRVFAGNSRFQIFGYNKTRQLKETKEDKDDEYIKLFLDVMGLKEMPKDQPIYHLDLRLTPKKADGFIVKLLKQPEIDFEAIENAILAEAKKRIYFPKKIRDTLKINDWKNPFKKKLKKPKPKRRAKK